MKHLLLILLLTLTMSGCSVKKVDKNPTKLDVDVEEGDKIDKKDEENSEEMSVEEIIVGLFAEKFEMDKSDISLQDVIQDDNHAAGMVIIGKGGPGGAGGFLASSVRGDWEIVWDGNGVIECALVDSFDFPERMLPSCYNDDGVIIVFQEDTLKNLLVDAFLHESGFENYVAEDIEVTIDERDDYHAKGGVLIQGGGPGNGGGFLAANTTSGWVLVWHGNGAYMCDDLAQYNFPASMSEGCYAG